MGYWTTESSKALWERVKSNPKTHTRPPFPVSGYVEVAAMCRHTPIRLAWNCEQGILVIDGKPVKILYDGEWAFKVCREGIYTIFDTGEFVYQLLSECADDGPLDTMYYDMLKKAEKICARAEIAPPCVILNYLIYYTPVKRDRIRRVRLDRKTQQPKGDKEMERYDYKEAMRKDIRQYLDENWEKGKRIEDRDRDKLHEDMWVADGVTGNGSGSYTFNSFEAEENVCHNLDLLGEALDEFCVDGATLREKMGGEWADVVIRCYLLGQIESEIFDEWNAKIDEEEESEDEEEEEALSMKKC